MLLKNNIIRWSVDQQLIITPQRRFHSRKNASVGNFNQLIRPQQKSTAKTKLRYNKWFIKPEKRMKTTVQTQFDHEAFPKTNIVDEDFFYQSLYSIKQNNGISKKMKPDLKKKVDEVKKICSDGQNIKLLNIFKRNIENGTYNKRNTIKRRTPGMINFILNFNEQSSKRTENQVFKKRHFQ